MAIGQASVVSLPYVTHSALRLTADTVLKDQRGYLVTVNILVVGSAPSQLHDIQDTAQADAANLIAVIPNTIGTYTYNFPFFNGLTFIRGAGQEVSISFA